MEFRKQDNSMGMPSSFRYHPNQDPASTKRRSTVDGIDPNETHNKKQYYDSSRNSGGRRDVDLSHQITSEPSTRYRECQKNHAAHLGSHVVDGCGEFMESGEEGRMRCSACDCHRNFHRKEINTMNLTTPVPFASGTMMMCFGGGGEDLKQQQQQQQKSSKRFRTKFTQEHKEKMMLLAEKIGWRIQKQDEEEVHRFCVEEGVKRQVFKVWMHNNRQAIKRKHS